MSLISGIKIEQYEEYVRVREIEESRVVIDHVMRFSFVDKFYYWKILRLELVFFCLGQELKKMDSQSLITLSCFSLSFTLI